MPALSCDCVRMLGSLLLHSHHPPSRGRPAGRPLRWLTAKLQVPVTPAAPVASVPARRGATAHGCLVRPALARRTPLMGRLLARLVRALPPAVPGARGGVPSARHAPRRAAIRRHRACPAVPSPRCAGRRLPGSGRMLCWGRARTRLRAAAAAARLLSWPTGTLAAWRPLALPSVHRLRGPRAAPAVLAARRRLALATPVLPSARVRALLPVGGLRRLAAPRPVRVPNGAARRRRGRGRNSGGLRRSRGPMAVAVCCGCRLR